MKIDFVTDKTSKGILFYIINLNKEIRKYEDISSSIKNYNELFSKEDIAHFHFSNSTRKILFSIPFFFSRKKICTIHDIIPRTKIIPLFLVKITYFYMNIFINHFIVHSEHAKEMLKNIAPFIRDNKIFIVPHGTNIISSDNKNKLREKYRIPKDSFIFLMLGDIKKDKGQMKVLDIFKKLKLKNTYIIIVGKIKDEIFHNIFEKKENNILFTGYVSNNKMLDYLKLSDCLISFRLNSVGETSGPILLAIGAGKPIICTTIGSFPETVKDAGMLIKTGNELSFAMKKIIKDRLLRDRLSNNALRLRNKYSWKNISKLYMRLYGVVN